MIGKTISSYKLIEVIGIGGMSTVYLGRHTKTGSVAAVKVLKEQYTQEEDHVKKFFIREIEATKKLNHKNIVKLLNYGEKNGKYYLIYEYIDGLSLDKLLAKKKKLSIKAIEKIVLQILAGLSHAHSMEVIHRDIKPQNILVTDSGVTKITDFGIAKAVSSATITQTGLFMGSPAYISPEQAEGKEVSNSSDIYSLGVILFEMLTRKLPFTASTTWGIVNKHINEPAPDISKIAKSTPDYLTQTVSRCLNKDPHNRFDDAEEMANAISTESCAGETIIKKIEVIRIGPDSEKEFNIDREEKKISLNDSWRLINKKKLSIGAVIVAAVIWVLIGSVFYSVGNKYYNEGKYISAAHNFKTAQNMLIPNAENSKFSSLGYYFDNLNKLMKLEEYEAVVISVGYIEENFPEYTEVQNIKVKISKVYNEKKDEYLILIRNENFTDAKDILSIMSTINGENDSFIEKELLVVEDYAQSETYISQALAYLEEGRYDQMFEIIGLAKDLTPDYSGISKINSLINDEHSNLKKRYEDYFEDYDFENSLIILNQMLDLKKGNDSYSEKQIEKVYLCIDSDNYIAEAIDKAGQKNYDGALEILEYAIGENPDYGRIYTEHDIIKEMKEEYDGFIGQINNISNLNNNNNYLDAYNQANSLLNNSDFVELVLQDDVDRLNGVKSSAYNSGKNIPGNSVSFNLYASNDWQTQYIKNIFGNNLYRINFSGRSNAAVNPSKKISCAVSVEDYSINLVLISRGDLIYTNTGDNMIKTDRKSYPNAVVDVAINGRSYSFSSQNRTFITTINSMSLSNFWFEILTITVRVQ